MKVDSIERAYQQAETYRLDWPEPAPHLVRDQQPPAPDLPLGDILGQRLAEWVSNAAEAKGAPPDYVLAALFSAAGATIGNSRWVSPWQGWAEPPLVWTMCVGLPSSGKSPALDAVVKPLRDAEKPLREAAERERQDWGEKNEVANVANGEWQNAVKAALKDAKEPPAKPEAANIGPKPPIPRLVVNDATVERLGAILAEQPRGILQMRDELAGWLGSMTRYLSYPG